MRSGIASGIAASLLAIAASADLQGEWTRKGEYGVPFERPPQFGTRQFLTDSEYATRLEEVRLRDERDLAPVDVFSGRRPIFL
jgi:hypothetical protein